MKRAFNLLFAALLLFTFASCTTTVKSNKINVMVEIPDNGIGFAWAEELAKKFNETEEIKNSEYQIKIKGLSSGSGIDYSAAYKAGVKVAGSTLYTDAPEGPLKLMEEGYLLDLSDILDRDVDGNGKTIREKIKFMDSVSSLYKNENNDGELYALPYTDSFAGFIFDFELFKENGWLITEADGKLSAGRDGEYNTYDDGQPTTLEEFANMLIDIRHDKAFPFIFTTKYAWAYLPSILDGIIAQYMGKENYKTYSSFDGNYVDASGNIISTITPQTGYKVFDYEGLKESLVFFKNYILNEMNIHPSSWETIDFTHREAQNNFILGYKSNTSTSIRQGAMLLDGIWFENEARPIFSNLESRKEEGRGYGDREFRYMLYPQLEGSLGANGDGTGSSLACMDLGVISMLKSEDPIYEKFSKDFLAYTLSNEALSFFTTYTGIVRPYNYSLSTEQYNSLTPFQKNVWDLYNDDENIHIVRPRMDNLKSYIFRQSTFPGYHYVEIGNSTFDSPYLALLRHTGEEVYNAKKTTFNEAKWQTYYSQVEKYYK